MLRVLFVCTDNYTRSVTVEFCLKHYLKLQGKNGIEVFSAGFKSSSDLSKFSDVHFNRMDELGIDTSTFQRRQFKVSFLEEFDVVVAMGIEHKEYVFAKYGKRISLFNQIYKQEETSIHVPPPDKEGIYLMETKNMVDYINSAMPIFLENLLSLPYSNKWNKEKPLGF